MYKSKKDLKSFVVVQKSKLKMASSRKDSPSNANISTSVRTKLQKWIGKANKTVREKRIAQEISAEIVESNPLNEDATITLSPQHSRSRSSPIPMRNKEKTIKKSRKWSVNFSSSDTLKEDIARENERNHSYSKNGIPHVFITPSVQLDESPIVLSDVQELQNQKSKKETIVKEQTCSVGENTTEVNDSVSIDGTDGLKIVQEVPGSNASEKRKVFALGRSQTSLDQCELSEAAENGRMISAVSLDSIPTNVQQLSGQIQSRLQVWVERASYLASQSNRRQSEESASSTDDGSNTPNSSQPLSVGSENYDQMKKIKELELALKELVGNIGIRGGSDPSKIQDLSSTSPGSSISNRSRNNSEGLGSDHGSAESIENQKDRVTEKESRNVIKTKSRDVRYLSSSSSEPDTVTKGADSFDKELKDEDPEDFDGIIYMKSSHSSRQSPTNYSPRDRKSLSLQDVLICETLIESAPRRNEKGDKKIAPETNGIGMSLKENVIEVLENEASSAKTELQNGKQSFQKNELKGTFSLTDATVRNMPSRPKLRRHAMSSDSAANFLKSNSKLTVRDSMRKYLDFKDADLSAFAVECVRHANKKKQSIVLGDDGGKANPQTFLNANNTETAATEQNAIVSVSSQDSNEQTVSAKGLGEETNAVEDARSSELPLAATDEITSNHSSSSDLFSHSMEEAEKILASASMSKEPLEMSSSNPQVDIDESTSQRLYKFPSMPMFYVPERTEESNKTKRKREKRKSVASPASLGKVVRNESDPFLLGSEGSTVTSNLVTSSSTPTLNGEDENENLTKETRKGPSRPKLKDRKLSAPSTSSLFNMTSSIRVDIEALI